MSVKPRGNGWQLDWYDEHGKRQRPIIDAPNKGAAKRVLDAIKLDVERRKLGLAPEAPNPMGYTVADLAQWWLDGHAKTLKSFDRIKGSVKVRIIKGTIGHIRAERLTAADVETWIDALVAAKYAGDSVNQSRAHLSAILNKAVKNGRVRIANVVEQTSPRGVDDYAFDTLTIDEVKRVLAAEKSDDKRAIYATAILAGLRREELWNLRRSDVDMDAGTLRIAASKAGKMSLLPIHPELRPHLARALLAHPDADLVFPSPRTGGKRSTSAKTARDMRALCKRIGINKNVRFHDLRHTAVTLLIQAGASLAHAQRFARHASPETTANKYAHLLVEDLRDASSRVSLSGDRGVPGEPVNLPKQPKKAAGGEP